MALNWERLDKLRRDYPKPKFALAEVQRQLKKKSNDPYLLAWNADIALRLGIGILQGLDRQLQQLFERRPPITDSRLLGYLYDIQLECTRRQSLVLDQLSAGKVATSAWENAAKAVQDRKARLDIWSGLFLCAMRQECWDDVRTALNHASQQGVKAKKRVYFTTILANQLSYERQRKVAAENEQPFTAMAQVPGRLACQQMKKAFENAGKSAEDSLQVQDIRDIRFMAQVFGRQCKPHELFALWRNAPRPISEIFRTHQGDIVHLKAEILKTNKLWALLASFCKTELGAIWGDSSTHQTVEQQLVNHWYLIQYMMDATQRYKATSSDARNALTEHTSNLDDEGVKEMLSKILESETVTPGRPYNLTRMALASHLKHPLLPVCTMYWLAHRHLNGCFHDLRSFVKELNISDQEQFHSFITTTTASLTPEPGSEDEKIKSWFRAEINVLKFDYLLTISMPVPPDFEGIEHFVDSAIRLYKIGTRLQEDCSQDAGCLAIMALLAYQYWKSLGPTSAEESLRYMLQAAILSLRFTSGDTGKQNRPLLLLSTRLHITLGLVGVAFDQYNHVQVKEILQDTLSHYLLSRISLIHPFDTTGAKKVMPDEELAKVIGTIERMERRAADFIYTDMQNFQYDQAIDLIESKRKLRSSLTKHLCLIERRRIARLKGERVDESLEINLSDYHQIHDNREFDALPNFEYSEYFLSPLVTGGRTQYGSPQLDWLYLHYHLREIPSQLVYKESTNQGIAQKLDQQVERRLWQEPAFAEDHTRELWDNISIVCQKLYNDHNIRSKPKKLDDQLLELAGVLRQLHLEVLDEKPIENFKKGIFSFWERPVEYVYNVLELLQLLWKLCDALDEQRKKKNLPLDKRIKEGTVKKIRDETKLCYERIHVNAKIAIDYWKKNGLTILVTHMRSGPTGKAVSELISDDEVDYYAGLYLDASLDTLSGILKVKLKK